MNIFTKTYKYLGLTYRKMIFLLKVNWIKTIYFNFKMFPFHIAKMVPVYFFGQVKFNDLSGKISIDAPIKSGMIGFGQPFELFTKSYGIAEFYLMGTLTCKGHVHFGKDCLIYIGENANCQIGHLFALGSRSKLLCYEQITFGDYVRIGFESQISDSNFHQMIETDTGTKLKLTAPIHIGNYNWVGNRSSIMQKTKTPDRCIIASNSLCNKDYTPLNQNILIGGIPSKLLKSTISRDWEGEKELLNLWMKV